VLRGAIRTTYAYSVLMSIRHGLLALLEREPMYGYQLRGEFESATGATWPLNVGQVYTTLTRLERDGLVEPQDEDDEGRVRYAITDAGRAELEGWFAAPVTAQDRPRDELAIKLALAVTVPGIDVRAVIQRQRSATVTRLQDLTRLKAGAEGDLSWSLVLENLRFAAEAEVRWLDHCETALARVARAGHGSTTDRPAGAASTTRKVRR
jgi:DNA-binding PadR family transcriptional regulator